MPAIKTKPVTSKNWKEFETFFQAKGCPNYCWCMVWRMTTEELKRNTSADRKKFMKKRILSGTPVGILAYKKNEHVAWCSVAPRETYQRLNGDESIEKVWSLACFFIKKEHRKEGLVNELIDKAKKHARRNGAKYLEAYPVKPDSPSYRFMGFIDTFKKAGFSFVKMAGTRRHVMTCEL